MKKILFTIISVAAMVACQQQYPFDAYLDANGDCIFENNLVRYRINGPANPVVTSGMEAIFKAVVDKEELVKDRKAAKAASLNDGGSAILYEDSLVFPPANFESFEVLEKGDNYVKFKLTYPQWQVGELNVNLARTITLHGNSEYCEVSDLYSAKSGGNVTFVAGFAKGASENHEVGSDYIVNWENLPGDDGAFGVGIVMPMSHKFEFDGPDNSAIAYYNTVYGRSVDYAIGSCWSRGEVSSFNMWAKKVRL